jgi:hypothetical protein
MQFDVDSPVSETIVADYATIAQNPRNIAKYVKKSLEGKMCPGT